MNTGDKCPADLKTGPCPGIMVESSLSQYHICTDCRLWVRKAKKPREGR